MLRKTSLFGAAQRRSLILVSMDWTRQKDPPMSLGHASILANLLKHGVPTYERSYSVNHPTFSSQEVIDFVLETEKRIEATKSEGGAEVPPADVAFGAFIWNERHLVNIINSLKDAKFKGRIILGGPQISYVSKGIERYYPAADIFVRGYAEEALTELMLTPSCRLHFADDDHTSSLPRIKGVHFAGQTDLGESAVVDLEFLESPYLTGLIKPQPFIRFETQRGCPFRCAFCQHRESDSKRQRRAFAFDRIRREIDWITSNRVIQDVAVLDPTFNSGPAYLSHLKAFEDGGFTGKLSLQIRLEMMNDDFISAVERLNHRGARVVLEAGLQTIHKEEQRIIDRPTNLRKVKEMLAKLEQRRIETAISLIFGLPNQTVQSFKESIAFCRENSPRSKVTAFPLMLLRGTPLEARKNFLGLVESSDIHHLNIGERQQEGIPHVISSKSFTFDDWQVMAEISNELQREADCVAV